MRLEPKDNWVEVVVPEEKGGESIVVLPEDYKPTQNPYKVVLVVTDPSPEGYKGGDKVVVPTHIIREIEVEGTKFHLVERQHIMARIRNK